MNTRVLRLARLSMAIERGALEWWTDPRRGKPCLRDQMGRIYSIRIAPGGLILLPHFISNLHHA